MKFETLLHHIHILKQNSAHEAGMSRMLSLALRFKYPLCKD